MMKSRIKSIALVLILTVIATCVCGTSLAWLTAKSGPVTNTFTDSHVKVELKETKTDFKMVPGWSIPKDPKAWVSEDSEDCYLFVKVEESTSPKLSTYIEYGIDSKWTELKKDVNDDDLTGIYYILIDEAEEKGETNSFDILAGNKVTVKTTVEESDMEALNANNLPKLTFTAYAIQLMQNNTTEFTPAEAWANINN